MTLKVEKFFCLSLPKATLTIGFVTIVFGLLKVFILHKRLIQFNYIPDEDFTAHEQRKMQIMEWALYANFLAILTGLLLIIGTIKKHHLLLLPWLVMTVLALIGGTVLTIYFLGRSIENWTSGYVKIAVLSSVGFLFLTAIEAYMWIAVYSFSCKIREEKNQKGRIQYSSEPESANAADEECNPKHAFQRI